MHLNEGQNYKTISVWLLLNDSALQDYYECYKSGGLEALLSDNYQGGLSYLSAEQIKELDIYLSPKLHQPKGILNIKVF